MAVNTQLYLQPSLDIHLARSHSETSSQLLFLTHRNASAAALARGWDFDLDPVLLAPRDVVISSLSGDPVLIEVDYMTGLREIPDLPFLPGLHITPGSTTTNLSVLPGVRIRPGSTGRGVNVITITHPVAGVISANVHVHDVFNDWWFGIDSMTVPRSDINDSALSPALRVSTAQVTVYGHFDADPANPNSIGVIADITGHDYIDLSSANTSIAEVDSRYEGWLRGVTLGDTTISGIFSGGTVRNIPVKVVNWFGAPSSLGNFDTITQTNALLHLVGPRRGDPDLVPNMVFLSEGFLASEEPLFDRAVLEIKNRIFSAPRFKPFHYLREDINVWKAFIPSSDKSMNQAIDTRVRVNTTTFTVGSGEPRNALVQQLDTFYAFMTPARVSDNMYSDDEYVVGDVRRYPLQLNWVNALAQFLATLAEQGNPANRIGRHWYGRGSQRGKDVGLVVILCNEKQASQEANYGYFCPIGFYLGLWGYHRVLSPGRPLTAADPERHTWRVILEPTVYSTAASITDNLIPHIIDDMADVTTHELGHSLVLGDEYEYERLTSFLSTASDYRVDNISYYENIKNGTSVAPPQIDPTKLKWADLHRIRRSARINSATWTHADLNNISLSIQVKVMSHVTWAVGDHVYLREFKVTHWTDAYTKYGGVRIDLPFNGFIPFPTEDARVLIEDLPIATVATAAGVKTITMRVPKIKFPAAWQALADAAFRTNMDAISLVGGVLFIPKRKTDGSILKLIDDEVMQFMINTHAPLTSNYDASSARGCGPASVGISNSDSENPPANLTATSGRRLPLHSFRVVGAYEGADHATCRAYRPTGMCRMRSEAFNGPFCYVCQYLIVNRLNPSRLSELEADYPEFRT
ncbi:MAG TPA: M64 family metallopeptidase [Bacteroidia bacterium]|nr:M64 family metallopeptidase [Bacteroidia bacterium]